MSALLSSQAVFRSRALEVGFTEAAVEVAVQEGIASMGSFGFSTSFIPGQAPTTYDFLVGPISKFPLCGNKGPGLQDEAPLKELGRQLFGIVGDAELTRGQFTAIRRLYLEAGHIIKSFFKITF